MIPTKEDQKCARGRRHHQEPFIREYIIIKLSGSITPPDRRLLLFGASIKDTKIQITAWIVDSPVSMVGLEDAVNDEVRKCKK